MPKPFSFLIGLVILFLSACKGNGQKSSDPSSTLPQPFVKAKHVSKGSLSFKLDGQLYEADPSHAKAWQTGQMPLALFMAGNDKGLTVSMQLNINGVGDYKIDSDKKGTVGFTNNGKYYWVRSVTGADYLDIHVTKATTQYSVILLSGTFDGVLEDKDGTRVQITEGQFSTESI
jgi:hypothetical protein